MSKKKSRKHDPLWAKAKKVCRLNQDEIAMAKELGIGPRALMKNNPSPTQQWKLPVKQWIRELHEKRFGGRGSHGTNRPQQPNLGNQTQARFHRGRERFEDRLEPLIEPQAVVLFERSPPPTPPRPPDDEDIPF